MKSTHRRALLLWMLALSLWHGRPAISEPPPPASGDWWSLRPLERPQAPAIDSPWIRTPIDAFILAGLREKRLEPAPEADRRTLIRRLAFDLHGLPPEPEAIEAFIRNDAPDASEKLVDDLLSSPRYGERWARYWLDVVHFGETHGYDKDKKRPNAWPYRDYVIRSFNEDKPFARFIEEQVAGDILFPEDPAGIVATGFVAAGPWDFVGHVELREGTVDKDIARSNDRDDMVAACMSTFNSLTVHCARCHDHKFDPIPQEDYYRLQAVFAGVDRSDRPYDVDGETHRLRLSLAGEKRRLQKELEQLQAKIAALSTPDILELDRRIGELTRRSAAPAGGPAAFETAEGSPSLGYHSSIMPSPDHVKWVQVDLGRPYPIEAIYLIPAHVAYGGHPGPGFGFPPRFRIDFSMEADFKAGTPVADHTAEDFPHPGDSPCGFETRGAEARYIRVTATRLWKRTDDWIFALGEMVAISGGRNTARGKLVSALDSIEAPPGWAKANFVDGSGSRRRLRESAELAGALRSATIDGRELAEARLRRRRLVEEAIDADSRTRLRELEASLAGVSDRLGRLPPLGMVYAAATRFERSGSFGPAAAPRPIHVLPRGDVRNPGKEVGPGALSCVKTLDAGFTLPDPSDEGGRRAALARWLSSPRNMLTWRSIANRIWQYHFGQGLVDSPNDFGRMGSKPTHPELLDWLACELRDGGGSIKRLHRLILSSAAYRQDSRGRPGSEAAFAAIDSGNQLLWRMNRSRLDAECVRDAALALGGGLDLTIGGPSVDHFYFKDDHSPVYDYQRFDVDSAASRRRSVYRFLVRSVPDPLMECLDCADPSLLTPRRNSTLTALQALAMLNNPFLVKQAGHLAERLQRSGASIDEQVRGLYRLALGREPGADEVRELSAYAAARGLPNACRLILNSNEFLFID